MEHAKKIQFAEIDQPDPHSLGTKGLVFVGDEVIVYRRSDDAPRYAGRIDVPGGAKEGDETPFQTFRREVQEEFGLHIERKQVVYARAYEQLDGQTRGWYLVAQLPAASKDDIVFGDEGSGYMTMPLDHFLALAEDDVWPAYQHRAKDFVEAQHTTQRQ